MSSKKRTTTSQKSSSTAKDDTCRPSHVQMFEMEQRIQNLSRSYRAMKDERDKIRTELDLHQEYHSRSKCGLVASFVLELIGLMTLWGMTIEAWRRHGSPLSWV